MTEKIPLLVEAPAVKGLGGLPGQEMLADAGTVVVEVAADVLAAGVQKVIGQVARMLADSKTDGTGWDVKEAKISLGIDANGQVSLWALKGQVGAKASLDITLRRP